MNIPKLSLSFGPEGMQCVKLQRNLLGILFAPPDLLSTLLHPAQSPGDRLKDYMPLKHRGQKRVEGSVHSWLTPPY